MIAVDTNVLVYAHRSDAPFHEGAARALRDLSEGDLRWAIPWPCIHEFLAKVTHPRIFKHPTPLGHALEQVAEWRRSPAVLCIAETAEYAAVLERVLLDSKTVGARIHDARIAAICEAHGVEELWTWDRDFSRFPRLRTRNPG